MKAATLLAALAVGGACALACSSGSSPSGGSSSGSSSGAGSGSGGSGSSSGNAGSSGGTDGAAGDTWASWAQGFFQTYCVECHSASDKTGRDFTQQSIVVANQDTIRCGVCVQQDPSWSCPASGPVAKQFPISDTAATNPKPSDADRTRVVAWIGAGCP